VYQKETCESAYPAMTDVKYRHLTIPAVHKLNDVSLYGSSVGFKLSEILASVIVLECFRC
jgi:hypothetical protein